MFSNTNKTESSSSSSHSLHLLSNTLFILLEKKSKQAKIRTEWKWINMLWCQKFCFYINLVILWWIFYEYVVCFLNPFCLFCQNPFFSASTRIHTWLFVSFLCRTKVFLCVACQIFVNFIFVLLRANNIFSSNCSNIREYDFIYTTYWHMMENLCICVSFRTQFYLCCIFCLSNIYLNPFSDAKHFCAEYQSCFSSRFWFYNMIFTFLTTAIM